MPRPRTVEIIAHRGASRDRLENTLRAFRTALAQGADGIELDVHATRDGVVVVHHDPAVRRPAGSGGNPSGNPRGSLSLGPKGSLRGPRGSLSLDPQNESIGSSDNDPVGDPLEVRSSKSGSSDNDPLESSDNDPLESPLEIAQATYAELCGLVLANGEQVPTLDDVLTLAAGKATVYVEVKGWAIEKNVLACLARHPNTATAVHSFDHRIPHTIGGLDSRFPRGILCSSYPLDIGHMIRTAGARDLWQHTALIDQAMVDAAHAAGARVVAWTENDFNHAIQLVQMGVDAICTDIPGPMRVALSDAGLVSPNPAG